MTAHRTSRRDFLKTAVAGASAAVLPLPAIAQGAGGRVVVVGVCVVPDTIQPNVAIVKEVGLDFVSLYTPAEFAECLTRLGEGRIDGSTIVTGAVGLDDMAPLHPAH